MEMAAQSKNLILNKILSTENRIRCVDVTQVTVTRFELRLTLQDWAYSDNLVAGDGGTIQISSFDRIPDIVCRFDATVEMVEDWMLAVAKIGGAEDVCKFEGDGYRNWLTKPYKWRQKSS